jgi:heterodisulfide reductase subunit A-like polyferredoxin
MKELKVDCQLLVVGAGPLGLAAELEIGGVHAVVVNHDLLGGHMPDFVVDETTLYAWLGPPRPAADVCGGKFR